MHGAHSRFTAKALRWFVEAYTQSHWLPKSEEGGCIWGSVEGLVPLEMLRYMNRI